MLVIVGQPAEAYFAAMLMRFLRLLTLAALALMPFGMGAASASPADRAPAAAMAGHCDEGHGQPADDVGDRMSGCTAGCAMALAEPVAASAPDPLPREMMAEAAASVWMNLPPETATPPPKHS